MTNTHSSPLTETTPHLELRLVRKALLRLHEALEQPDLSAAEVARLAATLFSGARAAAALVPAADASAANEAAQWTAALAETGRMLGLNLLGGPLRPEQAHSAAGDGPNDVERLLAGGDGGGEGCIDGVVGEVFTAGEET